MRDDIATGDTEDLLRYVESVDDDDVPSRSVTLEVVLPLAEQAAPSELDSVSSLEVLYREMSGDWQSAWRAEPARTGVMNADPVWRGSRALLRQREGEPQPAVVPRSERRPPRRRHHEVSVPPQPTAHWSVAPVAVPRSPQEAAPAASPVARATRRAPKVLYGAVALLAISVGMIVLSQRLPRLRIEGDLGPLAARLEAAPAAAPAVAPAAAAGRLGNTTVVAIRPSATAAAARLLAPVTVVRATTLPAAVSPGAPAEGDPTASSVTPADAPSGAAASSDAPSAEPATPSAEPPAPTARFDPVQARKSLAAAAASADKLCGTWSDPQLAPVSVTFAPSGRVTRALLTGGSLLGTSAGSCVAHALHGARLSPFQGESVTVHETLTLP